MAPPLERILFSVFDVHLWTKLPLDPNSLNPAIRFLADPGAYASVLAAGSKLDLARWRIFPLGREAQYNGFWKAYALAAEAQPAPPAGTPDVREWLLPLRCRPKDLDLGFNLGTSGLTGKAHATVWLWPFGWSSSVTWGANAAFGFDDVRAASTVLRGKTPPPFTLAGKQLPLSELFRSLGERLVQDIVGPGATLDHGNPTARRIVLTVVPGKDASLLRYTAPPPGSMRWSDADRARMHGALLGRQVTVPEVIDWESRSKFMRTDLDPGNFALTHFEQGTLLVLGPGTSGTRWRETRRCLARNITTFSLVAMALSQFVGQKKAKGAGPDVARLAAAAKEQLDSLPGHYANAFSHKFLESHAPAARAGST